MIVRPEDIYTNICETKRLMNYKKFGYRSTKL